MQNPPLVYVASKADVAADDLINTLQLVIQSGLPDINRAILEHIDKVQREYFWDFVAGHWDTIRGAGDKRALAHLLVRRLAASLSGVSAEDLAEKLGAQIAAPITEDQVHPVEMYVLPPISREMKTGEIVRGEIQGQDGYCVVLTPSCDLVDHPPQVPKAERVLLVRAGPLEGTAEFKNWKAAPSNTKKNVLTDLLKNNRRSGQGERFHFLPEAFTVPNLLIDFQAALSVPLSELQDVQRLAVLDSPYAEALIARYVRYLGRVGTLDIDLESLLAAFAT